MLGTILSDMDIDGTASPIAVGRTIHATAERIAIKRHQYEEVHFEDFVRALATISLPAVSKRPLPEPETPLTEKPEPDAPVTLAGMFTYIDTTLAENTVVIADVGESLFASADLHVHQSAEFLSPAYYTSMGFAVPAAVGAGFAAPALRPLVLVGDGAFQMTGTELSTAVYYRQAPIVVVLNNRGYTTEREIMEGPFNDIAGWSYEKVCDLVGGGRGYVVRTHGEFVAAMTQALEDAKQPHVLNVLLDPADRSPGMVRLAKRLAKRLALG
jgi:indolepyruvate decarboxylase